jgi:hypothetical protein
MQDAFNLGWKLALVVSGNGSHQLMESYEAERRPVDRSIVKSGDKAYSRMDPKGDKARQEVIEFMATPEGQDYAALAESEIGLVYEPSPLVEEIGSPPPASPRRTVIGGRVGDVANLVTHDGTLRLHDLIYGKGPSLFVLPGDTGHRWLLLRHGLFYRRLSNTWAKFRRLPLLFCAARRRMSPDPRIFSMTRRPCSMNAYAATPPASVSSGRMGILVSDVRHRL